MSLADWLLYRIAKNWPSPITGLTQELNAEPCTEAYEMAYAQRQFNLKVMSGIKCDVVGLDVLEIGCGHGGISCFMAAVGARSVTGIDLNTNHLIYAERFAKVVSARFESNYQLPVKFIKMTADKMSFSDASFDLVIADSAFEHFIDPEAVMKESFRVIRPGGGLFVPVFSSILSKYGLHLKHGLKLPWANVVFSEKTIIRAMYRLARDNPFILDLYPGLSGKPSRVRDLRPYRDLNDITFAQFKTIARGSGFEIVRFKPQPTLAGYLVTRVPALSRSIVMDILSTGALAYLKKAAVV